MQVFLYNTCHVLSDFNTKQLVQFNCQYSFFNFFKKVKKFGSILFSDQLFYINFNNEMKIQTGERSMKVGRYTKHFILDHLV